MPYRAQRVGHREQPRIGLGDGFVFPQLFDQHVGLRGIRATEHGAHVVDATDLIAAVIAAEVHAEDILLVREAHFPATIAELYNPDAMPADLRGPRAQRRSAGTRLQRHAARPGQVPVHPECSPVGAPRRPIEARSGRCRIGEALRAVVNASGVWPSSGRDASQSVRSARLTSRAAHHASPCVRPERFGVQGIAGQTHAGW